MTGTTKVHSTTFQGFKRYVFYFQDAFALLFICGGGYGKSPEKGT